MPGVRSRVLAIFGPTASGKTAVAEALAELVDGEPISADSMQVYEGLPILTNQPERPTRLVGIWPLEHEASVGEYAGLAHEAIDEVLAAGRTPILTGGTGLYFRAALCDLRLPPPPPPGLRTEIEALYEALGPVDAHRRLEEVDPDAAGAIHPNDRRRVVRALELASTGRSLRPPTNRLWTREARHPTVLLGLDVPPAELAGRIRLRTLEMFERGVEDEVARATARRLSRTAGVVIGLREIAELPREEAIEAVALRTRQYAAYQRKWLRRIPDVRILSSHRPAADVAREIATILGLLGAEVASATREAR